MHIAVIGSGRWSRVHLAALAGTSKVTLVGRNEAAVQRLASEFKVGGRVTTDLAEVFDDPSIDVADIVLPHHLHYEASLLALQSGKHVICEKPASLSLDQFDDLLDQAQRKERRFMVVMNQLYNPFNQRVKEIVDAGEIGRPFLLVENAYSNHAGHYRDPNSWRTRLATAGGGVLIDGGYHMIYKQLSWLESQGYPSWVTAEAAQLAIQPGGAVCPELGEDFVSYNCGYAGSLRINSSHAWTLADEGSPRRQCLLAGDEGSLEIGSQELVLCQAGHRKTVEICGGSASQIDTLNACLQDYVSSITKASSQCYGSNELARRTLQLILAIYQSSATNQRVRIISP